MSQEHILFFSCIGGCRGEKAADIQTLTHRDQPSAMTTSSPVLTFTWLLKGTLRAAEGELTLLLISSYTCFSQSVCGFKATIKAGFVTFGWLFLPHLKTYSFTVSLDWNIERNYELWHINSHTNICTVQYKNLLFYLCVTMCPVWQHVACFLRCLAWAVMPSGASPCCLSLLPRRCGPTWAWSRSLKLMFRLQFLYREE